MKDKNEILENLAKIKKKRVRCDIKGKSRERELVKKLNSRFEEFIKNNPTKGAFSRSVGSGNRWGQRVSLSENSVNTYAGDITCPDGFKFVIESKKGYNKIDLVNCFSGKCSELDEFLKQVSSDAERTKRKPLLIWKKDRKEDIAFLRESDLPNKPKLYLLYNGWIATTFDFILSHPDNFFF